MDLLTASNPPASNNRWSLPATKEDGGQLKVNKYCKRVFLLLALLVPICELSSIQLFLWPVDHYCARPKNLSNRHNEELNFVAGPNNKKIDLSHLQINPFDANPLDEFTRARALSMGISYDDISSCFEYPIEINVTTGTSLVNMESLESCRYGLHFEIQEHSLSLIDDFKLACSRQWLKIMMPQALGVGLLLGLMLTFHLPNFISSLPIGQQTKFKENYFNLLLCQILIGILLICCTKHLLIAFNGTVSSTKQGHMGDYYFLINCVFFRSMLQATSISRIIKTWLLDTDSQKRQMSNQKEQPQENHIYFTCSCLLYIVAQSLVQPLLLRTFDHWTTLNEFLSIATMMSTILLNLVELSLLVTQDHYETVVLEPNKLSILDQSEITPETCSHLGCEFCRVSGLDYDRVTCKAGEEKESIGNHTSLTMDTYEPTTITQTSLALREDHLQKGTNFRKLMKMKIVALMFCLSLNYLLLKMLPDNSLSHQEAVKFRVNHNYLHQHHEPTLKTNLDKSNQFFYTLDDHNDSIIILSDRNQSPVEEYRSFGYARRTAEWMDESGNPLKILWSTISLNGWPIEVIVLILHINAIISLESAYFKLSRLFSLIQFGSKTLVIEWILLALLHGKYHLVEANWLYNTIYTIARFCSTLMLYHFLHTILKLSRRLSTDQLLSYMSSFSCISLALILASFAPTLIKVDLVVVPLIFVINNMLIDWIAKNLRHRFAESLCPMIFEETIRSSDKKDLIVD